MILLGGIQINMPFPLSDYFEPLVFEVRRHNQPTVSIFEETFGSLQEEDCVRSRQLSLDAMNGAEQHGLALGQGLSTRALLEKAPLTNSIPPTSPLPPSTTVPVSPRGGPDWEGEREKERRAAAAATEKTRLRLVQLLGDVKSRLGENTTVEGADEGKLSDVMNNLEEALRLLA